MNKRTRLRLTALGAALCLALTGCTGDPAPEATPTPAVTESGAPEVQQTNFVLACYPEAGFHPITGSNRTNLNLAGLMYRASSPWISSLRWSRCCARAIPPRRTG